MADETIRIVIEGRDNLSRPAAQARQALSQLQTAANGAQRNLHGIGTAAPVLARVGQQAQRTAHNMEQMGHSAKMAHGGMIEMAKGMLAAMVIMKVMDTTFSVVADAVWGMNARLEQSKIGWTTLLKSGAAAEEMLDDLKKFAATTPFEFPELEEASRRLLAMGFAAEDVIPTMTTVGNAAAALGTGSVGIERITRALGQMRARMKVSSQEMIQLTEAGVPAWEILAEAMNLSVGEVMKLTEEGEIASTVFIDAFNKFVKANWGDMMAKQARTFLGALSTIKDNTRLAAASAFEPLFERLSSFAVKIADFTQTATFEKWADQIAKDMNTAFEAIRLTVERVGEAWNALGEDGQRSILLISGLLVARGPLLAGIRSGIKGVELLGKAFTLLALTAAGRLTLIGIAIGALAAVVYDNLKEIATEVVNIGMTLWLVGDELRSTVPGLATTLKVVADAMIELGLSTREWRQEQQSATEITENMLRTIIDEGVPGFNMLTEALETYTREGLEKAWRETQKWVKANDTLSKAGAIDKWLEETYRAGQRSAATIAKLQQKLGGPGGLAETAKAAGVSLGDLVQALVAVHPATMIAAFAVARWESAIARVNLAISANRDQLDAAQAAYRGMQERLGSLNAQLDEQRRILSELATPRLQGMGLLEKQIAAVERQLKRLTMAEMGLPSVEDIRAQYANLRRQIVEGGTRFTVFGISTEEAEAKLVELRRGALEKILAAFPEMTAEMRAYLATLPLTSEGLEQILEQLRLTADLKFDEALQKIKDAAEGVQKEMTFDEAIRQIGQTKDTIASLTREIGLQQDALRSQESLIAALETAAKTLNDTLAAYQEQLSDARIRQGLLNDALALAYGWFVDDRQKVAEMGAEGVRVAGVMDEKTRVLLAAIDEAASGTTATSTATLASLVGQYKLDMARAVSEVGKLDAAIRAIPTSWTTVHTLVQQQAVASPEPETARPGPGFQRGGSFVVGGYGTPDSQIVSFRASPGERVTITPSGRGQVPIDYDRLGGAVARALRGQTGGRVFNQTINTTQHTDAGQSYLSLRAVAGV